jgi:peptide/nickel transport system substrate-binding protein
MSMKDKLLDALRFQSSEIENHVIDEVVAGHIDRRAFLRHGSALGLALPVMGGVLGSLGLMPGGITGARAATGGTIRVAQLVPASAVDPVTTADVGGLCMLQQTGEFLCVDGADYRLKPVLATSWKPNADGSVWTFELRKGVKFSDGQAFGADDVVATFDRLTDPKSGSNALSNFKGVLTKGNIKKVDDHTVEFHLDSAHGNFPYYVSSDNYNAIILPANYAGGYEKSFIGTGPFKLESYTAKVGATFVRNPNYWGRKALPEKTVFTFYNDQDSQVLAFQGHQVDMIVQVAVQGAQALLNDAANINVMSQKSSAHQQMHMRCDTGPFTDKRVRQALALTLDRPKLIKGLFKGRASIGNDSPFAPIFPSTDKAVPQRARDIGKAKQLLAAAGVPNGFSVTLTTEKYLEIPQYAQLVQSWAKDIGIDITLKVESQDAYYGKASFGQSDWLDSPLAITDYGHRGVPDVFLNAPLTSDGSWNAAHFKNPTYDKLVGGYMSALDLSSKRHAAGEIEKLLLDETPIVFSYFYDFLTVTTQSLKGVQPSAIGQVFLANASFA